MRIADQQKDGLRDLVASPEWADWSARGDARLNQRAVRSVQ